MRAKAQKWGNSLAVRIPKAIADQAGVREDDELDIDVYAGAIRLTPRRPEPSLAELMDRVTTENLHGGVDFGRPMGGEEW